MKAGRVGLRADPTRPALLRNARTAFTAKGQLTRKVSPHIFRVSSVRSWLFLKKSIATLQMQMTFVLALVKTH